MRLRLPLRKISTSRYFSVTGSDLYIGEEPLSRALDRPGDSCPTQGRSEHTVQPKNPTPKEMFYRSGVWSSQQGLVRQNWSQFGDRTESAAPLPAEPFAPGTEL